MTRTTTTFDTTEHNHVYLRKIITHARTRTHEGIGEGGGVWRQIIRTDAHTHDNVLFIHIYTHTCVCVCACICSRHGLGREDTATRRKTHTHARKHGGGEYS